MYAALFKDEASDVQGRTDPHMPRFFFLSDAPFYRYRSNMLTS
ncbi:hypothetical protein CHCC20487_4211 [Bacillus licheniformis]|nr:hypothetical protein CHCC20487_4211 [Bacillus licheniformis]